MTNVFNAQNELSEMASPYIFFSSSEIVPFLEQLFIYTLVGLYESYFDIIQKLLGISYSVSLCTVLLNLPLEQLGSVSSKLTPSSG